MTISVISLRRLTAHWGGSWWRGQIMGSRWSATNRRLAEETEDRRRRADILVDRELAGHWGAAVAEPAFIAGPGVDARIERGVRPGCVPWPHALVLLFAPWTVRNQARVESAFAVIPGVHVKDLGGAPRSESGHPSLVERISRGRKRTRYRARQDNGGHAPVRKSVSRCRPRHRPGPAVWSAVLPASACKYYHPSEARVWPQTRARSRRQCGVSPIAGDQLTQCAVALSRRPRHTQKVRKRVHPEGGCRA